MIGKVSLSVTMVKDHYETGQNSNVSVESKTKCERTVRKRVEISKLVRYSKKTHHPPNPRRTYM